ncbi:MAG: ribosomal protein S18-alanine N-acetyltransferase [Chitinophagales bacterium]
MKLVLREMKYKDLDQVLSIEKVSFPVPWSRESYQGELKNIFATYIVAEEGFLIIGYCGVWCIFDEAHITNIAVHPQRRGKNLGQLLMLKAMETAIAKGAHRMTLEVRPSNERALALYQRLGFEAVGLRKGYYSDNNEDAIIMDRVLIPGEKLQQDETNS